MDRIGLIQIHAALLSMHSLVNGQPRDKCDTCGKGQGQFDMKYIGYLKIYVTVTVMLSNTLS